MNQKARTELAVFRFSLIAPIVSGSLGNKSQREYLEEVCARKYDVPGLGYREFSPVTLKSWLTLYRRYGLEGLKKKTREDRGKFRTLSQDAQAFILQVLKSSPKKPALYIYQDLLSAKIKPTPSLSTVQRFIKQERDNVIVEPEIERRRYECQFANDCWQSDVCAGPSLLIDGKKKRTYLVAFIDDASRLIVHSQYFFEENYRALEETFRQALLKRGIPKKLFVDNGKIYHSKQLQLICARLGIVLAFSRPYSPASKGKIERYFGTHRRQFINTLDLETVNSLEELNRLNTTYVEGTYNQRSHSSLNGFKPIERFLEDEKLFKFVSSEKIEHFFLHEVTRRVNKDATISLECTIFEVPQIYCGQRVTVLYKPYDLTDAYIKGTSNNQLIRIEPVRVIDNSKIPRKQNRRESIDYTKIFKGG